MSASPSTTRSVRRATAGTVAAGVAGQLGLLVTGIGAARVLGVEDRGHLALLALIPVIVSQLGSLGVPLATTYFIAREPLAAGPIVRALWRPAVLQTAGLAVIQGVILWPLLAHDPRRVVTAGLVMIAIGPAMLLQLYGLAILQGQGRLRPFNVLRLLPLILYNLGVAVILIVGNGTLLLFAIAFTVSNAIGGVTSLAVALHGAPISSTGALPTTRRRMVAFGLKGLLGSATPAETFRVDQAVVGLALSPAALGIYVAAVAFTTLPRLVATSIGLVAYPHVASKTDKAAARRSMLAFVWLAVAACGALIGALELLTGWLVPFLFGREFDGAIGISRILLIGALFLSVRRVLSDGLRGAGHPGLGTLGEMSQWIWLAPAMVVLTPLMGLRGVAIALSSSYAVSLATILIGAVLSGSIGRDAGPATMVHAVFGTVVEARSRFVTGRLPGFAVAAVTVVLLVLLLAATGIGVVLNAAPVIVLVVAGTLAVVIVGGRASRQGSLSFAVIATAIGLATFTAVRPIAQFTLADVFFVCGGLLVGLRLLTERDLARRLPPPWLCASAAGLLVSALLVEIVHPASSTINIYTVPISPYSPAFGTGSGSNLVNAARFATALLFVPTLIACVADSRSRVDRLIDIWLLGTCVNCAVAILDFFGLRLGEAITGGSYSSNMLGAGPRIAGLTSHPNLLAMAAGMALPVSLTRLGFAPDRRRKLIALSTLVLLVAGILASGSRSGLLMVAVSVLLTPVLIPGTRGRLLYPVVLVGGIVLTVVLVAPDAFVGFSRLIHPSSASALTSDTQRTHALSVSLANISARPVIGSGFQLVKQSQDIVLQMAEAGGVLAVVSFGAFGVGTLGQALRLRIRRDASTWRPRIGTALGTSTAVWFLGSLLQPTVFDRFLYIPAGLILAATYLAKPATVDRPSVVVSHAADARRPVARATSAAVGSARSNTP